MEKELNEYLERGCLYIGKQAYKKVLVAGCDTVRNTTICSTLLRLGLCGLLRGLGRLHVLRADTELPRPGQLVDAPSAAVHDEYRIADSVCFSPQ